MDKISLYSLLLIIAICAIIFNVTNKTVYSSGVEQDSIFCGIDSTVCDSLILDDDY